MIGPELFTPAEAAALLGCIPKTVGRLADRHGLSVVRTIGRHRRFVAFEIRALAAEQARGRQP
jgi:excisionase family DNA binding protein